MRLTVATCQFPVDADIRRNLGYVLRQMAIAKRCGALVAHFPECALSGYAGTDFASYKGFDWSLLEASARKVLELATAQGTTSASSPSREFDAVP